MSTEPEIPRANHKHMRTVGRFVKSLAKADCALSAVEIGVAGAELSAYLLHSFPTLTLHLVDPWLPVGPQSSYAQTQDRMARMDEAGWSDLYRAALARLEPYAGRFVIWRMTSDVAWEHFPKTQLVDLVFIDGEHSYQATRSDIRHWWAAVRPGGILCGHDYHQGRYPGVTQAVTEFAERQKLEVTGHGGRVWAIRKPGGTS